MYFGVYTATLNSPSISVCSGMYYTVKINYSNTCDSATLSIIEATGTSSITSSIKINGVESNTFASGDNQTTEFVCKLKSTSPSSIKLQFNLGGNSIAEDFHIDDIYIYPTYHMIKDSNNGFSSYTTSMKLLIEGSSSNDTNRVANAENGYYTIVATGSDGKAIGISDTITAESAGETITVRGQTDNYSDIIINKRFYELPADMLKLMDVKIKNHKNGNDKYRSVERTVYRPLEQDGDNI